MSLTTAYRAVGLAVLVMASFEWIVLADLQIPPFVIGSALVAVSFLVARFPQPLAILGLALAVLIPVGAFLRWQDGLVIGFVPIFDFVVFGWLGFTASRSLGRPAAGG